MLLYFYSSFPTQNSANLKTIEQSIVVFPGSLKVMRIHALLRGTKSINTKHSIQPKLYKFRKITTCESNVSGAFIALY